MPRTLPLLAALLLQAALGEHVPQRLRKRRSTAAVPPNASVSSAAATPGGTDSGARWRVRLVESGNYLRCVQGAVTTGRFFFTLVEVRHLPDTDAVLLLCHGVGPLGLGPGNELTDGRPRIAVAGTASQPQRFWLKPTGDGYALLLEPTGAAHVRLVGPRKGAGQLVAVNGTSSEASAAAVVKLESVLAPLKERAARPSPMPGSFERKARRSAMSVEGRQVVLATFHNLGMLDWAVLFWKWLVVSSIPKLLLLDLDGLTCAAATPLKETHAPQLRMACASVAEMELPSVDVGSAGAVQDWGTRVNSGYFKFLQLKLRVVELVLVAGMDVVLADVDVLVVNPSFLASIVRTSASLAISSDARRGSYDDNLHCPCSNQMYQSHSADWVCAGLFYLRSTKGGKWFVRHAQRIMVQYAITDQDAIQVILTGHTQVAMPQVVMRKQVDPTGQKGKFQEGAASPLSPGYRPAGDFLKPMWLEDLTTSGNLRDLRNIQALNTPLRTSQWRKLQERQRAVGFTWEALPLEKFGNGPLLVDQWTEVFRRRVRPSFEYLSIHANCNSKTWLETDAKLNSFLFRPEPGANGSVSRTLDSIP